MNILPVPNGLNHNSLPLLPEVGGTNSSNTPAITTKPKDLQTGKVNESYNSMPEANDKNRNNLPMACSKPNNSLPPANYINYNNLPGPAAMSGGNQNNLPAVNIINQNINLPNNITRELPSVNGLHEIGGLKTIKTQLFTLVVLPKLQPQLYSQIRRCCSVLLYGPPGTGKTRLVHGLAAESGAVFLSISIGNILSSFVGETEKNIQKLFQYLRATETYTILFIDEIDSLCSNRSSSEPDYTRRVRWYLKGQGKAEAIQNFRIPERAFVSCGRIKTELMCQLNRMEHSRNCVIIAATNCPWDLDAAFLRRFQQHIFVPLATADERIELLQILAKDDFRMIQNQEQLNELIRVTDGFTGSDIANLVNDALHMPLNDLEYTKLWTRTSEGCYEPIINEAGLVPNGAVIEVGELRNLPFGSVRCRPVTIVDFLEAAKQTRVTVTAGHLQKYENYINKN